MCKNEELWSLMKFSYRNENGIFNELQSGNWWKETESELQEDAKGI